MARVMAAARKSECALHATRPPAMKARFFCVYLLYIVRKKRDRRASVGFLLLSLSGLLRH